jgi:hypothetical protein
MKSALLALNGDGISWQQGIVEDTADLCIRNPGKLSKLGMAGTDAQIIDMMRSKEERPAAITGRRTFRAGYPRQQAQSPAAAR